MHATGSAKQQTDGRVSERPTQLHRHTGAELENKESFATENQYKDQ